MSTNTALDLQEFRQEVCDFLDNNTPDEVKEAVIKTTSYFPDFKATMIMHKVLAKKGWAAPTWPVEHGGPGWTQEQRNIFQEEFSNRGLPFPAPQGIGMVAPAIMKFGTQEQIDKYLPPLLAGVDSWCQGYSEPNAGSDLVALQCKAESDGDDYVINGQKIWTTWAYETDHIFLLVRTSNEGRPQQGITFLLIDSMELPGMDVRTILGLDGLPEQAEVFFKDVRVPKTQVLGGENNGWEVAKYLLEHERAAGGNFQFYQQRDLDYVLEIAATIDNGQGVKLIDDPVFRHRTAELKVDLRCLGACENYAKEIGSTHPEAAAMASSIKILAMNLTQAVSEFALEISGSSALIDQKEALTIGSGIDPIGPAQYLTIMAKYLNHRATTIFGGTHQIQRDILAKIVLAG